MSSIKLNPAYLDDNVRKSFLSAYASKEPYDEGSVKLHMKPFPCCEMTDFIMGEQFIEELKTDLMGIDFYKKNNDLYKFHQSNDFKKLELKSTKIIRDFLLVEFRKWISSVTSIELLNMIDLTSSKYSYSDVLLCHDDELDSRRIAFVWYLVDPLWTNEDGGLLQLFNSDDNIEPTNVATSLLPVHNKLTWFEVSEYSHHQVSEVLSKTKCRLSVHGWFHSKPLPRPTRYIEPLSELLKYCVVEESLVLDWISPQYLDAVVQAEIRLKFEKTSEIQIPNFFIPAKYRCLCEAFEDPGLPWCLKGPVNKRKFYSLEIKNDNICDNDNNDNDDNAQTTTTSQQQQQQQQQQQHLRLIQECIQLLRSEAMFLILSNMTGLRFHRFVPQSEVNDEEEEDEDDDSDENDVDEENKIEDKAGSSSSLPSSSSPLSSSPLSSSPLQPSTTTATSGSKKHGSEESSNLSAKKLKTDDHDDDGDNQKNDLILKSIKEPTDHGPCDAKCCYVVRKWEHGCYATANNNVLGSDVLDALVTFNCDDWNYEYGGFTTYIAKDEDEELITIEPKGNSLNLVYREKDTLNFVKYIDHRSNNCSFFDISFTYFE